MSPNPREPDIPFFSICIPQYNRTPFLIEACRVLSQQICKDFELCISDDCSPEGRHREIISSLEQLGLTFTYRQQEGNGRYDRNLRAALGLARGRYCLLMGNDDCLKDTGVLERLKRRLERQPDTGVVLANYEEYAEPTLYRRVTRTQTTKGSADLAARVFRNFSFVSGIVLRRDRALAHATNAWDGSEMYQMYIASRILAEGFDLLEVDEIAVRKGIALEGQTVDSYATKPVENPCPIKERSLPFTRIAGLVCSAIDPYSRGRRTRLAMSVFGQILCFTYPFWILEYRRVQSWRYSAGICIGMRPRNLFRDYRPPFFARSVLTCLYGVVSAAGLILPQALFFRSVPELRRFGKQLFRSPLASFHGL